MISDEHYIDTAGLQGLPGALRVLQRCHGWPPTRAAILIFFVPEPRTSCRVFGQLLRPDSFVFGQTCTESDELIVSVTGVVKKAPKSCDCVGRSSDKTVKDAFGPFRYTVPDFGLLRGTANAEWDAFTV